MQINITIWAYIWKDKYYLLELTHSTAGYSSVYELSKRKILNILNIIFKMELQEVGWGGKDWIDLAQDRDR